ncbi:MAG: class I SAM-dependent methyltransferase [Pseudomonadota bacterium]
MRNKKLQPAAETRLRAAPSGKRLPEQVPIILETPADDDYALIDSGNGLKLEQYGPYRIIRPEAQAFWQPALGETDWQNVDAVFTGDTDEEGKGRWRFPGPPLGETWPMKWEGLHYHGRFTSFRHVGVFPEQAAHWRFTEDRISRANRPVKLLNLFGYTGLASLVGARAGAHVTHVDASKRAVAWARENQQMSGLSDKPIRWIVDDAVKFCEREVRRGNHYDAILLDPPKYGRGPKGEVWQLFEDLPHLLDVTAQLLSDRPLFVVLTAYSIRSSFFATHELCQEVFGDRGGTLESGELVILSQTGDRRLSTSLFTRWIAP